MTPKAFLVGLGTLLTSACGTVGNPLPAIVRTVTLETPIPADCGFHPTAEEPVDPQIAPALPPRPAATAPADQHIPYWTIRSQRAELGGVQMRDERDSARDALTRNAIPQAACASWYDAEMARREEREE